MYLTGRSDVLVYTGKTPLSDAINSPKIKVDTTNDFNSLDVEERKKEREIDKKILVLSNEDL